MPPAPVVVVGASLAGLRAAEAMRGAGHDGELVAVGDEPHGPYTRPPLSKELLAGAQEAPACAFDAESAEVDWRLGTAATALDLTRRRVRLDDGEEIAFSKLLIATGARGRPWPDPRTGALDGVFVLRRLDDALRLRAAFGASPRVAIVGAGFIGCEVAATARKLGLDVTLIELAPQPMPSLGAGIGARCADLHREHGVDLRVGTGVDRLEGSTRVEAVRLADDSRVSADVVVVALGALPNTEWLGDSGLTLQPGVVCDATLAAVGADDVFCAGDVAAWPHPLADGDIVRIEHWTVAAEQGTAADGTSSWRPRSGGRSPPPPTSGPTSTTSSCSRWVFPPARRAWRSSSARPTAGASSPSAPATAAWSRPSANAARRMPFYRRRLADRPPLEEIVAALASDERSLGVAADPVARA